MVNLRLGATQRLRLRAVWKAKCRHLQQLRARPRCIVTASNAFTGESEQVEVSCIAELRGRIETSPRFVNVRIFHNNLELSDFDHIETQVTYVREADPSKALVYLNDMASKFGPLGELHWLEGEVVAVKSTIQALCAMDLLRHHFDELIELVE